MKIYKYPFDASTVLKVQCGSEDTVVLVDYDPAGGRALPCLWIEHGERGEFGRGEVRRYQVFGTGHPIPQSAKWVGSSVMPSGLVWHVYQMQER